MGWTERREGRRKAGGENCNFSTDVSSVALLGYSFSSPSFPPLLCLHVLACTCSIQGSSLPKRRERRHLTDSEQVGSKYSSHRYDHRDHYDQFVYLFMRSPRYKQVALVRVLFFHRKLHLDPPLDTDVNCRLGRRTDADGGRGCCAAAVLLMNSGGACVERRRRVNEIIEGRQSKLGNLICQGRP